MTSTYRCDRNKLNKPSYKSLPVLHFPAEFIPHGRRAISRHPGSVVKSSSSNQGQPESSLLHKLKNVAISERSNCTADLLKASNDPSNEWWCVRQICSNRVNNIKRDFTTSKVSGSVTKLQPEFMDTELPNFKLKNEFNTSIKHEISSGSRKCNNSNLPSSSRFASNSSSIHSSKHNLFGMLSSADDVSNEPNPKVDCCYEEELYVKGKTAIWSKGLVSNPDSKLSDPESRVTISCYTCESPIKHAIFCNFHATVNDRVMFNALNCLDGEFKSSINMKENIEEECYEPIPGICIIDSNSLRAFTEDGEDYITSLVFQVKNVWSTKYGMLLEKEAIPQSRASFLRTGNTKTHFDFSHLRMSSNRTSVSSTSRMNANASSSHHFGGTTFCESDVQLPTCFSLTHPLDEMSPVLMKPAQECVQYYNDGSMRIVFVSDFPSICLIYCEKTGLHTLCLIRKATSEECRSVCGDWNKTSSVLSPSGNLNLASSLSGCNVATQKTIGGSAAKNNSYSWLGGIGSPYTSKPASSFGSPSHSRLNSPMAGMFSRLGLSPHASIGQASNSSMLATTAPPAPPSQPLYPDLCFEHIWTENQGMTRDNSLTCSAAIKTFLHCDHTGQNYLCYLVSNSSSKQLQIARLATTHSISHGNCKKLIVGVVTSVPAKDAVVLPSLNTIALIDLTGNIILYSGACIIGKVHIGGVLSGLFTSQYNQVSVFDTSFPRRSSLLPSSHSRDVPILNDSALHQLSPVPHHYKSHNVVSMDESSIDCNVLQGLRDPVGNRLTLEYSKGLLYRITLPDLTSSSLILKCIAALKQVLQKDIVMQVISKWYGVRNAPGTHDLCPKLEWTMFVSLLLSLLGYDVSKLTLTKESDLGNVEIETKRHRASEDGTQDDWDYLLSSSHHVALGGPLVAMLNLTNQSNAASKSITNGFEMNATHKIPKVSPKYSNQMDTSGPDYSAGKQNTPFNTNSLLFPYTLPVLYSLHLVYEELKMNILLVEDLEILAQFLHQLSFDLKLEAYVYHYWKDYPSVCRMEATVMHSQFTEQDLKKLNQPSYFTIEPPNIFEHLYLLIKENTPMKFPYLNNVNVLCRDIIEIAGLISNGVPGLVQIMVSSREGINASSTPRSKEPSSCSDLSNVEQAAVLMLCMKGYTLRDVQNLPPAINLFLLNTISRCKVNPPVDWPHQAYSLIMREDLALQAKNSNQQNSEDTSAGALGEDTKENAFTQYKDPDPEHHSTPLKASDSEKVTGLEHIDTKILRLRFPNDHRVTEVCNLLQSSIPVTIALTQRPEVSDHDFIEEQERHLYALCTRTMALPVGRGMVTLRSAPCVVTEPLVIPKLCATGRAPPRNTTIELTHIEVSPHHNAWPLFHNGVAAGLKLVPSGNKGIDSAWVVYNKPKQGNADMPTEHAGFLMALGLNGHLKDMAFMNIYEYLVKCHEMTSVGLLLGIAATYRGTMDVSTTKLMGIHVEALLPPTSIELDIPQNIQVAALLGVGLLYQGTSHTHMTQVLLSEIGRPPGPEMENSSEREGYSLAAGLGLGLVCLGAHRTAPHHLAATLRHYMLGGNKRPLTGAQKEKYKLPSFQIREGPSVNVDVTAPGASLALGMLFIKSGNLEVAKWLAPPPTHYLLDYVRPDLLLLRVIARGLILWHSIEPTEEWVKDHVPMSIRSYCFVKPTEYHIDYEAMNQVYCNIVAGACFSIGLRFAGSADQDAYDTIMTFALQFSSLGSKSVGELVGKSTIETGLNLILISAAMVMAGTGDLQIMRLCRQQRAKTGPGASFLTYGSQLAVHAALGLLFLGAGRYTLSTSSESIAALVCAFFPKFPTHTHDNRYHLQAFRHLYVLAAEPRLIIPRDITSGTLCYVHLQVIMLNSEQIISMKAPCLLPELQKLKEVRIADNRYWSIVFQRDRNWDQLISLLHNSSTLDVKQKAGCLSYLEDPQGFQSLLAQTLTTEKTNVWSARPENIFAFSNDPAILNFTKHYLVDPNQNTATEKSEIKTDRGDKICSSCYFLGVKKIIGESKRSSLPSSSDSSKSKKRSFSLMDMSESVDSRMNCVCDKNNKEEREFIQLLAMITYECVIGDTLAVLPVWFTFIKILRSLPKTPSVYHVWQLKLLFAQIENHNDKFVAEEMETSDENVKRKNEPLISNEFALSLKQYAGTIFDTWEPQLRKSLKKYIYNDPIHHPSQIIHNNTDSRKFTSYVTFYNIPKKVLTSNVSYAGISLIDFFVGLDKFNLDASSIHRLMKIVNSHRK